VRSGFGLLEAVVALAVAALAALAASLATREAISAIRLDIARCTLSLALLEARREAYARESTCELRVPRGATETVLLASERAPQATPLPRGIFVAATNRRAAVRFHGSGFADNATLVLADATTGRTVEVVVNQRGGIH